MQIIIQENGCLDKEITVLDTRLPYFYTKVKELFTVEPESVQVIIVNNKEEFCSLRGEETTDGAFSKDNVIYIYEPNQFGVATPMDRDQFFPVLYQELIYLFYKANKNSD